MGISFSYSILNSVGLRWWCLHWRGLTALRVSYDGPEFNYIWNAFTPTVVYALLWMDTETEHNLLEHVHMTVLVEYTTFVAISIKSTCSSSAYYLYIVYYGLSSPSFRCRFISTDDYLVFLLNEDSVPVDLLCIVWHFCSCKENEFYAYLLVTADYNPSLPNR